MIKLYTYKQFLFVTYCDNLITVTTYLGTYLLNKKSCETCYHSCKLFTYANSRLIFFVQNVPGCRSALAAPQRSFREIQLKLICKMNVKLLANLRLNSHHNPAIRRNPLRGFFDNLIFRPLRSFSRPSPTEPRCTLMKFVNVSVDNISANCVDCTTNSRARS